MAHMTAPYGKRPGLEGPFTYRCGRVLYYDPLEGKYWDPTTDWYLTNEEAISIIG
jgi:hypothetical protein